ncbi:MAG: murein transglycosylase [Proteobacteria bacterium]|nr:MAG: murein transglycosylase [Pseudomonadota bacterium]
MTSSDARLGPLRLWVRWWVLLGALTLNACAPAPTRCDCPDRSAPEPASTLETPLPAAEPSVDYEPVPWSALPGWEADAPEDAWPAFLASCRVLIRQEAWAGVCDRAQHIAPSGARSFFERELTPFRLVYRDGSGRTEDSGLITGYYEPVLRGSRTRSARYRVPLYAPPDDLLIVDLGELHPQLRGARGRLEGRRVVPYHERGALESSGAVRGKEIVWVDDEIDAFFLQVQGSGRIQLDTGETIRLAFADQNGHPYRSIGRYLADRGELPLERASAQGIREWLRAHPERMQEVLNANPRFVFFREEPIERDVGPNGALGVPLTAERSLAVDRRFVPLGAPIFLATTYPNSAAPLERLVMAQDTGGAILGALRADFFWGTGDAAGEQAGRMRQQGRMWLLWPRGARPQP